ncbi:calpain-like protease palB [Ascosphaera apis ARSEF 7405]|uniref:Calpain-like protease palB n=1 Tax=Ascosphaera apis ARSEF 7405 TaxID=392613 RepID=A0A167XBI2_9EURO|nr:calpain-like protease palB [Ascosphaera apis ARSEF 7405]
MSIHHLNLSTLESKAKQAESSISASKSQKQALDAAITAAELYLNAYRLASTQADKKRLDAKCNTLLTLAEKIKKGGKEWQSQLNLNLRSQLSLSRSRAAPQSTRQLSKREQIILLEGSKLHGAVFPPWTTQPDAKEFEKRADGSLFEDDGSELSLSEEQQEVFDGWKRPDEALRRHQACNAPGPIMIADKPIDLVQDATTDCSVVASMCAVVAHTRKHSKGPIKNNHHLFADIFPRDSKTLIPQISKSGKYILRLYFNGCYRRITIDDRLPTCIPSSTTTIHIIDRNNPSLLWPCLVEKAYLKIRGGYDFPGSNSGTDLWVLTGWIPEQIFLHDVDADLTLDEVWSRAFEAWEKGDVLVTIGTGELTEEVEKGIGLIGMHDYAVLDMRERDGRREMLVKNPWAAGVVWRGIVSEGYDGGEVDEGELERGMNRLKIGGEGDAHDDSALLPGTFWMDCEQIFQNFEHMYINWNPSLFTHREDIHFTWDLSSGDGIPGSFIDNPQFAITTGDHSGPVWLLLSKHFASDDKRQTQEDPGFISIYVFDKTGGKRVYLSTPSWRRGPFVDSPNTLLRLETPSNTTYTIVPSQHGLPKRNHNFSLSVFSNSSLALSPALNRYPYSTKLDGAWTPSTAGGNTESPNYPLNPQFSIHNPTPSCSLAIFLETTTAEIATNIKLLWSNGRRITSSFGVRDIVVDSGDYRRGCAFMEVDDLPRGTFTLICSAFKEGQTGKFKVWVNSTTECIVRQIPHEGAGRLRIEVDDAVFPAATRKGVNRILARLTVYRLTRLKVIARRKTRSRHHAPILMTIEQGQRPFSEFVTFSSNGRFDDAVSGVRIEDVDLTPEMEGVGGLWLVIERAATADGGGDDGQAEDDVIEIEMLAEQRVVVGKWRIAPEYADDLK